MNPHPFATMSVAILATVAFVRMGVVIIIALKTKPIHRLQVYAEVVFWLLLSVRETSVTFALFKQSFGFVAGLFRVGLGVALAVCVVLLILDIRGIIQTINAGKVAKDIRDAEARKQADLDHAAAEVQAMKLKDRDAESVMFRDNLRAITDVQEGRNRDSLTRRLTVLRG